MDLFKDNFDVTGDDSLKAVNKTDVNGASAHPVFKELKAAMRSEGGDADIEWNFVRRMFDHPALSDEIVHPYDVENRGNSPGNRWGQRVTSMIPNGPDLFIATSAKSPFRWDPKEFPFLAPDKWKSYGKVYRVTMPGHLAVPIRSTGPTTIEFIIEDGEIAILQDGKQLAKTTVPGSLGERIGESKGLEKVEWGDGIYGRFAGASIRGSVSSR